jgi:hypothetical protein
MDFERVLRILGEAEVDVVVIGGIAAAIHGSARLTSDLDIAYSRRRENLRRLVAALRPYHPRPRDFPKDLPFVWDEVMLSNSTVLTLNTDLGPIDLLSEVAGVGGYDDIKAHAVPVQDLGPHVSVLDLPALIASKRASARPKDLEAISELESLLEAREDTQP